MRDVLLRDTDQMGMANSLEIRVPFLDHRLVELVLAQDDRVRTPTRPPKRFLVDTFSDLIPEEVAVRSKQGFALPMDRWMRGPLKQRGTEAIDVLAEHGAFRPDAVQATWQDFLQRNRDVRWSRPWLLVVLGSWMDRHSVA